MYLGENILKHMHHGGPEPDQPRAKVSMHYGGKIIVLHTDNYKGEQPPCHWVVRHFSIILSFTHMNE